MAKKDKTTWIILGIGIVALIILLYGGNNGWFKSVININGTGIPSSPSSNQISTEHTLRLSLSPDGGCSPLIVTGIITSNMPNANCMIYARTDSTDWEALIPAVLNANGGYTRTETVSLLGNIYFKVVCSEGNNLFVVSNTAQVNVRNCSVPAQATCYDSDNGINWEISGHCEDSFHQAGFIDSCSGQGAIEWFCNSSNVCESTFKLCGAGQNCFNGVCQSPPCGSIVEPDNQQICSLGTCLIGSVCQYIPADLAHPARCACSGNLN